MQTVKGKYQDGKIQLLEPAPQGSGDVLVIFLNEEGPSPQPQMMQFGMFASSHQSTETDFKLVEFAGDADDSLNW